MTTFPYGYSGTPQGMGQLLTWDELMTKATVTRLHPEFLRRVRAMCEAAATESVPLGIGTGWRIQPVDQPGFASPGNSNHEGFAPDGRGAVAADMVPSPSWDWMEARCAAFGLRTFRDVNGEPWHVQPAEIPAGRDHRTAPWDLATFALPGPDDPPAPVDPAVVAEALAAPPPFDPLSGQWSLWPLNPGKSVIHAGSNGDAVSYCQGVINLKAGGGCDVDGTFGGQTEHRVRDLQNLFHLTVDGRVGRQTWGAIDFLAAS